MSANVLALKMGRRELLEQAMYSVWLRESIASALGADPVEIVDGITRSSYVFTMERFADTVFATNRSPVELSRAIAVGSAPTGIGGPTHASVAGSNTPTESVCGRVA
ncbi:MAG: hypothetical protein WB809_09250 [Thermoplasmata archaeon]